MNREDLLRQLSSLQEKMSLDVDTYKYEERSIRIAELADQIHDNDIEITRLLEKLENNENYFDQTPRMVLDMQLGVEKSKIDNLIKDKNSKEAQVEEKNALIDQYEAIIAAKKAEIKKIEAENIDLEIAIRRAKLNNTPGQGAIESGKNVIEENLQRIASLKEEIKFSRLNDIKPIEIELSTLESEVENLSRELESAQQNYDAQLKEKDRIINGKVDVSKKNADKKAIKSLESANNALENEQQLLAYDFAGEINKLITDLGNGNISVDELKAKLEEIKSNLPKDYLQEITEKIAENEEAQNNVSAEIEALEAKLSDDSNYERNPEAIAREKAHLADLKKSHANYKKLLTHVEQQNKEIKSSISAKEKMVSSNETEINELNFQIELNYESDREFALELEARRNELLAENKEIEKDIELDKETVKQNLIVLEDLKSKEARSKEIISFYTAKVNNNNIDKVQRRADEIKLNRAKASLEALQNYHRGVLANPAAMIDEIINNTYNYVSENEEIEEPIVTPVGSTTEKEEKGNDTIVIPFPKSDGVRVTKALDVDPNLLPKPKTELTDDDLEILNMFNIDNEIINNNEEDTEIPSNVEPEEEEKENVVPLPIPMPVNFDPSIITDDELADIENFNENGFKPDDIGINDDENENVIVAIEENENLKEQANKKGFFKKAKEWVKNKLNYVLAVGTLVVATAVAFMSPKLAELNNVNTPVIEHSIDNETNIENEDNIVIVPEESKDDEVVQEIVNEVENTDTKEESKEDTDVKDNEAKEDTVINNNNNNSNTNNNGNNSTGNSNGSYVTEEVTYTQEEVKPVDPSTIIDEHPDNNIAIPTPTPDIGEQTTVTGVTGNETVEDDDFGDIVIEKDNVQEDKKENNDNQSSSNSSTSIEDKKEDNTIDDSVWDFVIEDEYTNSDGTAKDKGNSVVEQEEVKKEQTEIKEEKPAVTNNGTVKVVLSDGETLVINGASIDNNGAKEYSTDKDIMLEDSVSSVQYVENSEADKEIRGEENIEVEVAARDHELTEEEVETIRNEQYGTTKEEMDEETRIWMQNNLEKLQALRDSLQNSSQEETRVYTK